MPSRTRPTRKWASPNKLPSDMVSGERGPRGSKVSAPIDALSAYVRIDREGKVSIVSPMAEMGQGVYTSLPMLVAEELDADMSNVAAETAPANDKFYGAPATGSIFLLGIHLSDPPRV